MIFKKTLIITILILGMTHAATQLLGSVRNQSSLAQAISDFTAKLRNLTQAISQRQAQTGTTPNRPATSGVSKNATAVEIVFADSSNSFIQEAIKNRATAIVNPTDPTFKQRSALSQEIIKATGGAVEEWILHRQKQVDVGNAVHSSSGDLQKHRINYIIHAFPPNFANKGGLTGWVQSLYTTSLNDKLGLLFDTYTEIFKLAEHLNVTTLALPPLCAGNNRGDLSLAQIAQMAFQAFNDYLKDYRPSHLKKIIFITNSDSEYSAFISAFPNQGQSIKQSAAQQNNPPASAQPKRQIQQQASQPYAQQKPLIFIQNMNIIQAAQFASVDTIVNAANDQLKHGGGLSGAIFDAVGSKNLTAEINQTVRTRQLTLPLKTTENAVTSAGTLKEYKIKAIIHAVGPDFRTSKKPKELLPLVKDTYKNIFKRARELGSKKIAIPPISAGIYLQGSDLSLNDVATQTALAFKEFLESRQTGSIEAIFFCTYPQSTTNEYAIYKKAFSDEGINFTAAN